MVPRQPDAAARTLHRLHDHLARRRVAQPDGRQPSRAIFFVAAARSLGIPAWIDPVTGNLFYRHAGKDVPVDFESANDRQMETGRLKLRYEPIPRLDDPEYFRHFTLSRFDGQSFALLNYPDFEPWSARFDTPTDLETGYYMLATGSRLADGACWQTCRSSTSGRTGRPKPICRCATTRKRSA